MPVTAPSEATHERILEAAVDAFAEHGYSGTSVRTIAASAGANVAAINYHFGSKERLWTAVCDRCAHQVGQAVQGALQFPLEPARVLDDVLGAIFDLFAEDQRPVRVLVWVWMQADSMDFEAAADTFQPLVDLCFQYIEHLQSRGELPDVDAEIVMGLIEGVVITPFIAQVAGRRQFGADFSNPEHAARVKAQVLRAARLLLGGTP